MNQDLLLRIQEWDGNGVVFRYDEPTGTWIFIALHDDTLGPSAGGTRMKVYPSLAEALTDAMRLAGGMTAKWAGIGVSLGGGKAVLAIPRLLSADEKEGLLMRYGGLVESLRGAFATGADLGIGADEMAIVARRTRQVFGVDYEDGSSMDPGPFTARGVLAGLVAAVGYAFGSGELAGRSVLVEGLGGVGEPLARSLTHGGAKLLVADIDHQKAESLAQDLGATVVALKDVATTVCDVYAPCAVGATLNRRTIPELRCRVVAGSANNQLEEDADADRLHARGIVYAPDFIINAGGATAFALLKEGVDRETIDHRVAAIGDSVAEILREAKVNDEVPLAAALRRIEGLLEASRRH